MTQTLAIQITGPAARQIRDAESWWRINRLAAPDAIAQELERAFSLIAAQPDVGGLASNAKLPNVRRIYMPRIKYHIYYHVILSPRRVEIVAFWHSRRGHGPPI